jgi:uncharacterized protein with FMN-binding domain
MPLAASMHNQTQRLRASVILRLALGTAMLLVAPLNGAAQDVVVLKSGARQAGRVISQDGAVIVLEMTVGKRTVKRKIPKNLVVSILPDNGSGGTTPAGGTGGGASAASNGSSAQDTRTSRSKREVLELIEAVGRTPPEWYDATQLNHPASLDLTWPEKPPGGWDASKNVGQYIWDRINPNPAKWREGVKLMHHIMTESQSNPEVVQRAMRTLGTMYHNLHEDYARAAFWYQQAGVDSNPSQEPMAALHLADCYFQLGNQQMAMEVFRNTRNYPMGIIKVLGDMGETAEAIRFAEQLAKQGKEVPAYLYAGDVCRVASRLEDAERYYRKALAASSQDTRNKDHSQRDKRRAEASLAAIRFYQIAPSKVADGTYTASSLGYEDQVEVAVTVRDGRIEAVKVTQHREKQFYSSLTDTPRSIIARQGVVGVDTTSGATITSEAIINATATALSKGLE